MQAVEESAQFRKNVLLIGDRLNNIEIKLRNLE
jgi:hypothetical protein